ncbi:MAG: hypothetical protein IPL27_11705 [Lewinellaceae bacterium]|nr:hypothetical protein [Lewinellaceae bacterium]
MEKEIQDPCTQKYGISGKVWCDDFTDIYVGHCDTLSEKPIKSINYEGNKVEKFGADLGCCDYLYLVCWSNDGGVNGLLADIAGVYTNNIDWEVFPTGLDFDAATPRPTRASVLAQIQKANCHHKWVKPFQGPLNNGASNPFTLKTGHFDECTSSGMIRA